MLQFLGTLTIPDIATLLWLSLFLIWGFSRPQTRLRRASALFCVILPSGLLAATLLSLLVAPIFGSFLVILLWSSLLPQSLAYAIAALPSVIFWRWSKKNRMAICIASFLGIGFLGTLAFAVPMMVNRQIVNSLTPSIPEVDEPIPQKPRSLILVRYITHWMDTVNKIPGPSAASCERACIRLLFSGEVDEVFAAGRSLNKAIALNTMTRYTLQEHPACAYKDENSIKELDAIGIERDKLCPIGENVTSLPPGIEVRTLDYKADKSDPRLSRVRSVFDTREPSGGELWYQNDSLPAFAVYPLRLMLSRSEGPGWLPLAVRKEFLSSPEIDALNIEAILTEKLGYSLKPLPEFLERKAP